MYLRKLIIWAAYLVLVLGILCPLLTIVGAIGNRTGLLYFRPALGLFLLAGKAALPVAGAALAVFLATLIKKAPRSAKISAIVGVLLAISIYVPYHVFMARAQTVPRIHDITTDTENPPVFVRVPSLRGPGLNSLDYGGPKIAEQQQKAYPEVKPAYLNVDKAAAFSRTLAAAKEMGWGN